MKPASRAVSVVTAAAIALASVPVRAQTGSNAGIPMIRDAEIEQLMRDYTAPILRVAGLTQQNVQVVIINDKAFNAFVMDAHRIFINTGALMEATTPNQLDRRLRPRDRPYRRRPSCPKCARNSPMRRPR